MNVVKDEVNQVRDQGQRDGELPASGHYEAHNEGDSYGN
jgi:hypothetical protein